MNSPLDKQRLPLDPLQYIKPEVQRLKAYTLKQPEHRIKLNQNENPYGFPAELKELVWERARQLDWARYPDFHLQELTERLAEHAGVPPDWLLVGNGSNELIQVTLMVTLAGGTRALIPQPTFTLYKLLSQVLGAEVDDVLMQPQQNFALPVQEMLSLAQAKPPRVVVICSPNNPTGRAYPLEEIRAIIEGIPALVVVDEAYREFNQQDLRPLLEAYPNVVLLRTFSKARAMAGIRVGYMLARPEIIREVNKAKLPYGMNILSEAVTLVALDHPAPFLVEMEDIRHERAWLTQALQAIPGVHPYPSDANFILCRLERPTSDAFAALVAAGVLVRDVSSYPQLANHLRLTVGAPAENQALIAALASFMRG